MGTLKELKEKVKTLQSENASLRAQLAKAEAGNSVLVERAELHVRVEMQKEISAAFDKGYERCEANLKALSIA